MPGSHARQGPDRLSPEMLASLHDREPMTTLSTLWQLWRGRELVAKALMTYRNADVKIFGPGIEHIGVKNAHRRTGLGTLLHQAIVTELLRPQVGWMPGQTRIGLQAIYVTGYHRFFEKLGYLWSNQRRANRAWSRRWPPFWRASAAAAVPANSTPVP